MGKLKILKSNRKPKVVYAIRLKDNFYVCSIINTDKVISAYEDDLIEYDYQTFMALTAVWGLENANTKEEVDYFTKLIGDYKE